MSQVWLSCSVCDGCAPVCAPVSPGMAVIQAAIRLVLRVRVRHHEDASWLLNKMPVSVCPSDEDAVGA